MRVGGPPANRRRASLLALAAPLAFVLSAVLLAPAAGADLVVCGPGAGAGQCEEPRGVAVDRSSALLYVADEGNRRIDVFDADSGAFIRAFGWDVIPSGQPGDSGTGLEVCTPASTCKAGSMGPGSGQLGRILSAIAVDNDPASPAYHDVYVYDGSSQPANTGSNNRVQRFHPNGEFVLMFGGKVNKTKVDEGAPEAQQNLCTAASGDVCQAGVGDTAPGYFNSDSQLALGLGGVVYVADSSQVEPPFESKGWLQRVQKFDPSGALIEALGPLEPAGGSYLVELAVDSSGDFYVFSNGGALRKYDSSGALLETSLFQNTHALALDAADSLFFANNSGSYGNETAIYQYDHPGGTLLRVLYGNGTLKRHPVAIAPYQSVGGDIFAVEPLDRPGFGEGLGRVLHIAFEPPGPVVSLDPERTVAKPVGNTRATLNAQINPEGKATTYHFEYVDDATYQKDSAESGPGHGFDQAKTTPEEEVVPGASPSFAPPLFRLSPASGPVGCAEPSEALIEEGKCLTAETQYHFRAVATNADAPGGRNGPEATFTTKQPFEILATFSSGVGVDAAKLGAEVNPLSIPAKGRFEYVEQATYLEDVKEAEEEGKSPEEAAAAGFDHARSSATIDFGGGEAPAARSAQIASLSADTAYRYRVFVEDPFASEFGEESAFRTFPPPEAPNTQCPNQAFRIGASAPLPDCRAYEMVSPVDKEGGEIKVLLTGENISRAEILQSAAVVPAQGRGLTYSSYRAFGDQTSAPWSAQYLASRHPLGDPAQGWSSHGISPPRDGISFNNLVQDTQYKAFSKDLGWAWLRSDTEPPLEPNAITGFPNLYRRDNATDTYEAICPVEPKDVAPGEYNPKPQGASADGETVVFRADAKLTADASSAKLPTGQPIPQLYACAGGGLRLVSVTLGGEASDGSSSAGTASGIDSNNRHDSLHNAVSANAERVYWTDSGAVGDVPGKIYLRTNPTREQSALAHGAASGAGNLTAGSNTVGALIAAAGKGNLSAGSPTVTALETTTGKFIAGQPISGAGIPAETTIEACSPSCGRAATSLTLSKNATASGSAVTIKSKGPMPFAPEQRISGPGIPLGTTITAVALGSLTLSENATETQIKAPLSATSECSEPEKACTTAVSEAVGAPGADQPAQFWTASPSGSTAIFSFTEGPLKGNLYEFDAGAEATSLIAEGVAGLAGFSEDASRLYFVSTKELAPGAVAGEANLYFYEAGGGIRLIGTLTVGAGGLGATATTQYCGVARTSPFERCTRASPDGSRLAFISRDPLTGYDNRDAQSGEPDAEVFLYDASANNGEGELLCVSCNPSGARPAGQGVQVYGYPTPNPIAARIPGWEHALYAPRVLSADGRRLFFESFDALLPQDTNGAQDVYEWQEAGKGDCEEGNANYFASNGGCLSLISSGRSPRDSQFVDASADGHDVFFKTAANLLPQDPGLLDIYDARVEGGFPQPIPQAECEGEACQSPPAPPDDPTPASSAFEGAGNVPAEAPAAGHCRKPKVRRHGRCVPKKPRRHHSRPHHRARHSRRAAR